MRKLFDRLNAIDWSTVSRDDKVAAVSVALDAEHAVAVFHVLTYVWLVCALMAIFCLRSQDLSWAALAAGVTGLGLARLGIWARNVRCKCDKTFASLATEHPLKP